VDGHGYLRKGTSQSQAAWAKTTERWGTAKRQKNSPMRKKERAEDHGGTTISTSDDTPRIAPDPGRVLVLHQEGIRNPEGRRAAARGFHNELIVSCMCLPDLPTYLGRFVSLPTVAHASIVFDGHSDHTRATGGSRGFQAWPFVGVWYWRLLLLFRHRFLCCWSLACGIPCCCTCWYRGTLLRYHVAHGWDWISEAASLRSLVTNPRWDLCLMGLA